MSVWLTKACTVTPDNDCEKEIADFKASVQTIFGTNEEGNITKCETVEMKDGERLLRTEVACDVTPAKDRQKVFDQCLKDLGGTLQKFKDICTGKFKEIEHLMAVRYLKKRVQKDENACRRKMESFTCQTSDTKPDNACYAELKTFIASRATRLTLPSCSLETSTLNYVNGGSSNKYTFLCFDDIEVIREACVEPLKS